MVEPLSLNFQVLTVKLVGVQKINFMKTYNCVKVHNQLMLTFEVFNTCTIKVGELNHSIRHVS